MAKTKINQITQWDTLHNNGPFRAKLLLQTQNEKRSTLPSAVDRFKDTAVEIRRLIKDAADNDEGLRAYGSRWSLSSIAHHPERMHFNAAMNLKFNPDPQDCHHTSPYQESNLFFVQCGNTIKEISEYLGRHGKSLKTTGASNGQTIAGCISTGVHGSALNVGSVQDYVVGLNLIVGPNARDNVYLERHSRPALSDAYVQHLGMRLIRNDDLFNAALVGLGAFGFIHGVTLEGEDLFLLQRYIKKIKRQDALKFATTMAFKNTHKFLPQEIDTNGQGLRPYHYKIFINPYHDAGEYVVELIYKKPYRTNYPNPLPRIKKAIYTDLINLFVKIAERKPKAIPKLINALAKGNSIMPRVDAKTLGTLKETFWDAQHKGRAYACAVGIDHRDSAKAMRVLAQMTKKNPIPGIYAMRFVRQSEATLAFTQFPITCMLEIDGVQWDGTRKIISLKDFAAKMLDTLDANQIPFTLHWGKNADWSRPGLVQTMYGSKSQQWMQHRSALLSKSMCKVFSNDFVRQLGLDKHLTHANPLLAANLDQTGSRIA